MKTLQYLKNKLSTFPLSTYFIVVLFFLAFFVRFWKMEYIPLADDADELAYVFAGQSLLEKGVPISWSSFTRPPEQTFQFEVQNTAVETTEEFTFVQPWFDHMFLIPILMGAVTLAFGYHFPSMPPALLYRMPMVILAMLSLYLVFKISEKIFNRYTAIITFILLAFSPSFIFIQRMVVAENFILFFLLLAVYWYLEKKPFWFLILPTVLAAVSKVTGLVIVPIIFIAYCYDRNYKKAFLYAVGSVVITIIAYLIYGYSIDLPEFIHALLKQSHRLLGWSNPAFLFSHPGFYNKVMLDFSYYLILIFGLSAWFLPKKPETRLLLFTQIILLATIWATSAEQDMLGWYKILWFTFLALSAGIYIKQQQFSTITIFLILTCISNLGLIRYPANPLPEILLLRFGILIFVLVTSLLIFKIPNNYWKKILFTGSICAYVLQSLYVSQYYFASQCRDRTCPTPLITFTSLLKK